MPAKKTSKTKTPARAKTPARTKKKTQPSNGGTNGGATAAGNIQVRMYRVGFGDCFLLTLPAADGPRNILVDCGVHSKGNINVGGTSLIGKAVDNIAELTGKKLAIVVATHPHQDHISGFGSFAKQFGEFSIEEVWMPWTEDPNDPKAKSLHDKRTALVSKLQAHFAALGVSDDSGPAAAVANMAGNAPAFAALHSGFGVGAKVRYFKAGDSVTEPAGIKGLNVSILGPPTDQSFLSQMDPPANDHYLRLSGGDQDDPSQVKPFVREQWSFQTADPALGWPELPQDYKDQLKERANSSAEDLAFALDQCVNNCSIVALFSYQGKNLLFPGDAQYGNWKSWLGSDESGTLLSSVSFYKVAHHGSVNATPKEALEKMPDAEFAAMMSTQNKPWPSIPAPGLLPALDRKTGKQWIRSDAIAIAGAPSAPKGTAIPPVFHQGAFWFDYVLG
jgi:metallo-beta-lactamase superfamily protein